MIKNFIYTSLFLLAFLVSCTSEPENYTTFSGKVSNLEEGIDSVLVFIPNGYEKNIAISENGSFKDTLNVVEGKYQFKIGDEYGTIYLKNADKIHLTTDYKDFDRQLEFSGSGTSVDKTKVETELLHLVVDAFNEETAALPKEQFDARIEKFQSDYNALKMKHSSLEPGFWKDTDTEMNKNIEGFSAYFNQKNELAVKFQGKASPSFTYESIEGENVSLEDLRGKYVYLDIWATWCGPCKREIPALKEIEKKYHGKPIEFVSISIDKLADKEKWRKFVESEQLTGIQLFADNNWESDFIKAYEIQGIPRFILLDPDGMIVDADAPRPSSKNLELKFQELGI